MKKIQSPFRGFRFPPAIISCAVRWYHRFNLSLRDIEELLPERGVTVAYESVRHWWDRFGVQFAHCAKGSGANRKIEFADQLHIVGCQPNHR